jgi:hypothetical protein
MHGTSISALVGVLFLFACLASPAAAPPVSLGAAQIEPLVEQLGANRFDDRERAHRRLAEIGEPALDWLQKAAGTSGDLEIRKRAGRLVRDIRKRLFAEQYRFQGFKDIVWAVANGCSSTRATPSASGT